MIWDNESKWVHPVTGEKAYFSPDEDGKIWVSKELMDKLLTELGFEEQK